VVLSPLQPISERMKIGELGSPWAIAEYRAFNEQLGSEASFNSMISTLHENGIKVLMDWFPAICAYDSPLYKFALDSPAVIDAVGNRHNFSYNDVTLLDGDNEEFQNEVIGHMTYWLENYNLDGFRLHHLDNLPISFVDPLLRRENITIIAGEDSSNEHRLPFANYDLYEAILACSEQDSIIQEIEDALLNVDYEDGVKPINFTSNIYTQTQRGTDYTVFGFRYKMAAAIAFVSYGHTMIMGGQELPLRQNLSLYQHRPFEWPEKNISDLYRELILLKGRNKALHMNDDVETRVIPTNNPKVLCIEKKRGAHRFIGIFNFSQEREVITFDENIFNVNDYKMNRPITIRANEEFKVASMQFLLFSNV
jgi:glycosidase